MNTVRHQDKLLYNVGSYSKSHSPSSLKRRLRRDLTPLQKALYRSVTRNRDVVVETAGQQNRYANLLFPALLGTRKKQQGIRAMIVTSDPEDVRKIAEYFDHVIRSGGPEGGSRAAHIRVVQLGSVDSARKEAAKISNDPEVIISTPERMIDHIRREHLDLSHIKVSVIDEPAADKAPGFNADVEYIYTKLPPRVQTCVFVETLHEQTPVVTDLLKRPTIMNRSSWSDHPEGSQNKREKERPAVKKRKQSRKQAKEDRLDDEGIKKALKNIVYEIHHNEDPSELNWLRKQVRKNVSVFNRAYVAAYLLRDYMTGTDRGGDNGARGKKETDNFTSIFVGVGKNRHVYPKDLIELFTEVEGIEKGEIGQIKILDNYSFVEISGEKAKDAIGRLNGKDYRGRKLNVNYARKKES